MAPDDTNRPEGGGAEPPNSETPCTTTSAYFAWNDALAARYFYPAAAGQAVYLFVTDTVITEVGQPFGGSLDHFLTTMQAGPPGVTRSGHCQRALQIAENWRHRGYQYPPYVAYLGLFVLAAGHEGDFDERDYYPRLWELLGESREGTLPSFDHMIDLWDDLEKWSVRDMSGTLGLFEARIVGGKIHIGLPLAQCILSEEERHALPRVFAAAGLEPGTLPTNREFRRALTVHGQSELHRRTLSALQHEGAALTTALQDAVADEFSLWSGVIPPRITSPNDRRETRAGLRICLALDRVAGRVTTTLRCRTRSELPDTGLSLSGPDVSDGLLCQAVVPGWSSPLACPETGLDFVPSEKAWVNGIALADLTAGWSVRLQRACLRIFVEGRAEQLPGLVEALALPRRAPFYLACTEDAATRLGDWTESGCLEWRRIEVSDGLPPGWMFASVKEALRDTEIRAIDNRLGFPDRLSLRFQGGIGAAVRSTFFDFAPPTIVLEGGWPDDTVMCGEQLLSKGEVPGSYTLPPGLPHDSRLVIEVRRGDHAISSRSFYLVSGAPWNFRSALVSLDGYGRVVSSGEDGIRGAVTPAEPIGAMPVDPLRIQGLAENADRVFFIGRLRGEVAVWPAEPLPEWPPIWAIPMRRRGSALFCGTGIADASPSTASVGDREQFECWHTVLWRWRKRITPPSHPTLRALWKSYTEAARVA